MPPRRMSGAYGGWSRKSWSSVANFKVPGLGGRRGPFLWRQALLPGANAALLLPHAESTQTVQALQYSSIDGPVVASKEVEIFSLKEEIQSLKKQIAGV